jgi:hypothetical protein
MRRIRRRPCRRRHVFLSALRRMKQTFPDLLHLKTHVTHTKTRSIMSLAHLENARAMHLENESLELVVSREFSRKGVDFSHKKRLAQSHRVRGMLDRMRTNARKLVRLFFSLFLSYFFFVAFFKTTNTPLFCALFYASSFTSSDVMCRVLLKERTTRARKIEND